jgi:hypothetical protein
VEVQTARNSHQLAEAAIAEGNHKQAGGWLETTSDYVEDAASWSKQKLDTSETLRGVRAPRRKVKDGTYWSADEVKKGVDFLGGEIKKLGPGSLTQSQSPDRTTLDVERNRQAWQSMKVLMFNCGSSSSPQTSRAPAADASGPFGRTHRARVCIWPALSPKNSSS